MAFGIVEVVLCVVVGTLAAIVYSLRVLILMERRMSRIEGHVESISAKILREELKIERTIVRSRKKKGKRRR